VGQFNAGQTADCPVVRCGDLRCLRQQQQQLRYVQLTFDFCGYLIGFTSSQADLAVPSLLTHRRYTLAAT
jgi:hypothetical protein